MSAPHRDSYVKILLENIEEGSERNFLKKGTDLYNTRNTPFDFESIMIYGPTDYGSLDNAGQRRTTIQPLVPGVEIRQLSSWKQWVLILGSDLTHGALCGDTIENSSGCVSCIQGCFSNSKESPQNISFHSTLSRGAGSKTDLSLVDKIELARTYSEVSGEGNFCSQMKPNHVLSSATDANCFDCETVVLYAAHVDSLRQTCPVQQTEGKWNICNSAKPKYCSTLTCTFNMYVGPFRNPRATSHLYNKS